MPERHRHDLRRRKIRRDPAPEVWKQALDGLVCLASPEAWRALRSAADGEDDEERRAWIEEAIEQVGDAIEGHG